MKTIYVENQLSQGRPLSGNKRCSRVICRSCSREDLELILDLGAQPWGNHFLPIADKVDVPRFPLELYLCNGCTMVQIGHTIPKENMFLHHNYLSGTTKSLQQHFSNVCDDMLERVSLGPEDYVVDIGGNDGTFLTILQHRGIKTLNVESGVKQAEASKENGVPCVNKFFNDEVALEILSEHGPSRLIHGSGIFFHLEDLHSAFSGIKKLLHPEGMVVAEFIYLPEMLRSCAYDQIYHEHLLYYTIRTFDNLLRQHGLAIFDTVLHPIHGGSCTAYISHQGTAKKTSSMKDLEHAEAAGGYHEIGVYREFALRADEMRDKLKAMMGSLRSVGKRVQALGAPVKGTTIINYCGFTDRDIQCAVEINPLKYYTHYPGTSIPVYPQQETPEPDVYLLLAWNFKNEILSKLEDYRARGGKFLVPIPEPHII